MNFVAVKATYGGNASARRSGYGRIANERGVAICIGTVGDEQRIVPEAQQWIHGDVCSR